MGTTSSRNKPPPHLRRANTVPSLGHTSHNHSTNTVPATADDAAAFMDGFEQLVRLCENKDKPEADAQEVVDKLDQILEGDPGLPLPKKKRHIMSLMKICKTYCFVPTSHIVPDAELEKLSETPFKSEDGCNVWPGSYKGQEVSIKVLLRYMADDEEAIRRRFCREAVIWKRMTHPNILPFIGVTLSEELAVISPWMGKGDVMSYLRENRDANPVKLLEESVLGLQYLHETGIVHGGLQGRHILVNENGQACLANIGHASIIREQGVPMSPVDGSGHLRYSPPEYSAGGSASGPPTKQGDIYSMGMTIYEVLTDRRPFYEYSSWSVVLRSIEGTRPKMPDFSTSRGYTEELWELTTACWRPDPAKRPTVTDLLELLGNAASQWKPKTAGFPG